MVDRSLRDDVLAAIDIVDVAGRYVQLKRVGSNYMGLSPFKNERTPSFSVSPSKQIFKDFSTGIGGNVITFLMEIEKIEFWDALTMLAEQANIDIAQYRSPRSGSHTHDNKQQKDRYYRINAHAQRVFVESYKGNSEVQSYVSDRGLSDEIVSTFGLGYAPEGYGAFVQQMQSHKITDDDLIALSLARRSSHGDAYSFFRHRLIFPIHNHIGKLVAFAGRVINPDDQPKYLNTGETPLYDKSRVLYGLNLAKDAIRQYGYVVVVEGYMDVIGAYRLWNASIAVASCGTSLTPQHMTLLKRHTSTIYLCFDTDDAGVDATIRALGLCYEQGIYPYVLTLPDGCKDIDDLAEQERGEMVDGLPDGITKHEGFGYMTQTFHARYNTDTPQGRTEFLQRCWYVLSHIHDYTVLMLYIDQLATQLGVDSTTLVAQYKTYSRTQHRRPAQPDDQERTDESDVMLHALLTEQYAMGIIGDDWSPYQRFFDQCRTYDLLTARYDGEAIAAAQHTRDHHLDLLDDQKKQQTITTFCKRHIKRLVKQLLKHPDLPLQAKQEILQLHKSIAVG